MAMEVKTRRWGNSVGVVIPTEIVRKLNIKPEEGVIIEVSKKENVLKELFGAVKFRKPVKQIVKESRKELESKWLK